MKTNHSVHSKRRSLLIGSTVLLVALALVPSSLFGQGRKRNPTSKVFISDVAGEAQIDTGDNIQDLNKRSVYTAQGTIIETKKSEREEDKNKIFSTMVYSNGTGAYFDQDTKVEVKRFVQEPFTPNRTDMDVEPSISQTNAYVSRGTVGLCTSKLVAGSNMTYATPHGAINIRGKKIVIQATDGETKVSMLEGDSTIRGGTMDLGGHQLHAGEQAIIRPGAVGQPNQVVVQPIPSNEMSQLDDKVAQACMAKKTVYFEVKERTIDSGPAGAATEAAAEASGSATAETGTGASADTASGGSTGSSSGGSSPSSGSGSGNSGGGNPFASGDTGSTPTTPSAPITAFDGPVANNNPFAGSGGGSITIQEIVVVPVVPVNLPVQFTVSPARIVTPGQPGG